MNQQTGYVRQRESGLWEGQYIYQKQKCSIYRPSERQVRDALTGIIQSIAEHRYIKPTQHTLVSWMKEWYRLYATKTLRPGTFLSYESIINRHIAPYFGATHLENISVRQLQEFFNSKLTAGRCDSKPGGLSIKTLKNVKYLLNVTFEQAFYERLIAFNPVAGVKLPTAEHPEQNVMTTEEKNRLCDYAERIDTMAAKGILLLLSCGLRKGELLALQWHNVDLAENRIFIRKTLGRLKVFDAENSAYDYKRVDGPASRKNRTGIFLGPVKTAKANRIVYLPDRARQALISLKAIHARYEGQCAFHNLHDFVFCTLQGLPYDPRSFEKDFKALLNAAGLRTMNLHATRHTFATEAMQITTDIVTVSEILGHAKPSTTLDMYSHTFDDRKRALMAQIK